MKKVLLLLLLAFGYTAHSQSLYWDTKATTFSTPGTGLGQISYAGPDVVWAYGTDGSGAGEQIRVWTRSIDGGLTWTNGVINVGNSTLAIGSISAVSATTAYVSVFPDLGSTAQGGIWKTEDAGVTWTKQTTASFNTGTESFANIVHFWPDGQTGFAQGDPASGYFEIYTTTNGGVNWTRVPAGNITTPLEEEYGYTHNFSVNGDIVWFGTNKGRIYRSLNKGLTWTAYQTPISDFGGESVSGNYAFENSTRGILISSNFDYFVSNNGAETWESATPEGDFRNYNIVYVPGTTNTYVSTGQDQLDLLRGSSYTTDGGASWFNINLVDIDDPINCGSALAFNDINHGLAGGFTASDAEGGVYRWKGTFLANVNFNSAKSITASPNPTSGALRIAGKNINAVNVYDVLGKQVLAKKFSTLNEVELDLSALKSGVYMVNVANNAGATSTVKVVKQ